MKERLILLLEEGGNNNVEKKGKRTGGLRGS